jgi:hypothetical protein
MTAKYIMCDAHSHADAQKHASAMQSRDRIKARQGDDSLSLPLQWERGCFQQQATPAKRSGQAIL